MEPRKVSRGQSSKGIIQVAIHLRRDFHFRNAHLKKQLILSRKLDTPIYNLSKPCLSSLVVAVPSPLRQKRLPPQRPKLKWFQTCTTGMLPAIHAIHLRHDKSTNVSSHRLVETCTKKCIPPTYREADLNKGESVCLDRCVAKFFEVNVKVSEKMQGEAAAGGNPGGFGM